MLILWISEKAAASKQITMYVHCSHEPEEEAVSPVIEEELGTLEVSSVMQLIENVIGSLEPQHSELAIAFGGL